MWNVRAIDGLGVATFVTPLVGPFEGMAARFGEFGYAFGARFAVAAGLAATATASNLATFSLLPGLWFAARGARTAPLKVPLIVAAVVAAIGSVYGAFIGRMGPEGAAAFNTSGIRSAQSFVVFGTLGLALLAWAAYRASLAARQSSEGPGLSHLFLAQPAVTAVIAGLIAGGFSLGRPLAVFREFLLYTSQPNSALYGAAVVALQSLATMAIPLGLLVCAIQLGRVRTSATVIAPCRAAFISAVAMSGGGAFLIFYWGIQRVWPSLGRWGFQLGLYQ